MDNSIKIFLCTHKPIQNYIPKDDRYIIMDVSGTVKDDFHKVIDISQDEFVKNHNVCYSEGCALRWLYNHPEVIPDYICFGHYRRMFLDFVGIEDLIPRAVDKYGAIIMHPFNTHDWRGNNNKIVARRDHIPEEFDILEKVVEKNTPIEYQKAFKNFCNDYFFYACNIFAMKKEHFLEMCEMCFRILDIFDNTQKYKNNSDVFRKMQKYTHRKHIYNGVSWQSRLQGFLLEYLTDSFFRYKFGVENCYKSPWGIPKDIIERKEYYTKYKEYYLEHPEINTIKEPCIAIVHYNTPELLNACIKSIRKQGMNQHIVVLDNSTTAPFFNSVDNNLSVIDNTNDKLFNFRKILTNYTEQYKEENRIFETPPSNYHILSIEFLMHLLPNGFLLIESDTLLKKNVEFLIDSSVYASGTIEEQEPDSELSVPRLLPMLCWINSKKCLTDNISYFDYKRCVRFGRHNKFWYDTGASFLEDLINKPIKEVKIFELIEHYARASWGYTNKSQQINWLIEHKNLWGEDNKRNTCLFPGIYNIFANPKDDFMFNITCKNACSYIKYITLLNNNYNLEEVKDYHWEFIKNGLAYVPENMKYIIEPPEWQVSIFNPNNYKMIYIWRDPFERFVSTYNDKIKKNLWFVYANIGLTNDTSFEEFLEFAEHNIQTYKGIIEEHIRPQIDYYTTKIDYIVPIDKLQKFLQENNISKDFTFINSFPHTTHEYEKYRSRIYKLYEKDLNILEQYKDKVYT